jgi:hypothetical protein
MILNILSIPSAILLILTSTGLLLSANWRFSIWALSLQYVGVFLLVALSWRIEMAVAKLLAGWFSGAILGFSLASNFDTYDIERMYGAGEAQARPTGRLFRIFAIALVWLAVGLLTSSLLKWVPGISLAQILGGLILIGLGILQLGLTANPLLIIIGLLTVLGGFEIFYATVEISTLVAGLLAGVNLTLALAGAYFLTITVSVHTLTNLSSDNNPSDIDITTLEKHI